MAKARTGAQKPEVEKIMGQHHVFYFADGVPEKKKKKITKSIISGRTTSVYFADGLPIYSKVLSQKKYQTKKSYGAAPRLLLSLRLSLS